jgi:hypothetical protein
MKSLIKRYGRQERLGTGALEDVLLVYIVTFEVLTAAIMKITVLYDFTP